MENSLNLAHILKAEHEKKWVALSKDNTKVLAFDESLVELKKKVGTEKVVYMKVPPAEVYLTF